MGGMNSKRPTAIQGTMNHAKTSFSTEIFDGAIISVVQYLAPLRYRQVLRTGSNGQVPFLKEHRFRNQKNERSAPSLGYG
jgi:hypothetical protein